MKILAVTSNERVPSLPNVPTIKESGITDFELIAWFGIVAPKNTPQPIVSLINKKVQEAAQDEKFTSLLSTTGATPSLSSPAELEELLKSDLAKWQKVVHELSATAD
jgi:tripartite-type tricarboxylate transporter receptor subunit TctC